MKQIVLATILLSGCSVSIYNTNYSDNYIIETAKPLIGMHEMYDRTSLREFLGIDPVYINWCAAFVNSILEELEIPGSDTVHKHPLLARSFLHWGTPIKRKNIEVGDVVVFPRGTAEWQGHVGFFYGSFIDETGIEYWKILGGNQDNQISIAYFEADRSIGIRRWIFQH